jgi:hypothetical protein
MPNTAKQNPSNKVGRNSGGGPAGISEMVPTERERARGLEPIRLDDAVTASGAGRWLGLGLGALAVFGGGFAALRVREARRSRGLRGRLRRLLDRVR